MPNPLNLVGQRFGRLVALEKLASRDSQGLILWMCHCDCGNEHIAAGALLKKGNTKSCGCQRLDHLQGLAVSNSTHGKSRSKAYEVWRGMKKRCELETDARYPNYGARGISVCDRWQDFAAFYGDMGDPPRGKSIERRDVNGGYEASNCCWATPKQQSNNRRNTISVTYQGRTRTPIDWATELGLSRQTVYWRHRQGWPPEKVLATK